MLMFPIACGIDPVEREINWVVMWENGGARLLVYLPIFQSPLFYVRKGWCAPQTDAVADRCPVTKSPRGAQFDAPPKLP